MTFPLNIRHLLTELSRIPYENLSKIVAAQPGRKVETALDFSSSWLEDHRRLGLGGTCFALTHWLKVKMDALNFSSAYLMADKIMAHKTHEANIHCGLLFLYESQPYLLDPGYLIYEPIPLPRAGLSTEAFASPNAVRVDDLPGIWRLHSGPRGVLKHRFDFRQEPVDATEFQRHWEASYHWPMMKYPVLNLVRNGVQYYLQKNNLLVRTEFGSEMKKLSPEKVSETAQTVFGLSRECVEEALGILYFKTGTNDGEPSR